MHVNFGTTSYAFLLNSATDAPLRPVTLAVQPNYPNPVNPRTTFACTLGVAGAVRATVYDLRGRAVRRLLRSHLEAGSHEVIWDGRNQAGEPVAAGSYRFVVEAGENRAEGRALLLK